MCHSSVDCTAQSNGTLFLRPSLAGLGWFLPVTQDGSRQMLGCFHLFCRLPSWAKFSPSLAGWDVHRALRESSSFADVKWLSAPAPAPKASLWQARLPAK